MRNFWLGLLGIILWSFGTCGDNLPLGIDWACFIVGIVLTFTFGGDGYYELIEWANKKKGK